MDKMEKVYYSHFDVMKGIAIILVVMGHVMLFTFEINPSEPSKFIYFNMPLFFYISGFLAYRRIDNVRILGKKLLNRGMVLLIPYVVFLSIYKIFTGEGHISESLIAGGGRYWFLYDLFIFATFFLVYEYLLRKVNSKWMYVSFWILPYLILICIKLYVNKINGGGYELIQGFVNYYRYYLIGYLCRKYVRLDKMIFESQLVYALGLIAYFAHWYMFDSHNMILSFLGTLGAIIVIQTFVKGHISSCGQFGKLLIYLGRCSLGIYVIHYFFIPVLPFIKPYITCENPFIWQLTMALLVTVPIIAASVFVYKVIDSNRWLFLLLFGKRFEM